MEGYLMKPYTKIDTVMFGMLTALIYQRIDYYQREARPKEKQA